MNNDDDTIVLDLGDYGAAQPTCSITSGIDTITLDTSSIYTGPGSTVGYNGGYTINTSSPTYTTTWTQPYNTYVNIDADGLTMKEGADIKIGGKSLVEAIEKIEERLAILKPNEALEDRWEQLKALRQQYIDLEKDLLEKEKIMKILKET